MIRSSSDPPSTPEREQTPTETQNSQSYSSPSKNTRSQTSAKPIVIVSPPKGRSNKSSNVNSDLDVWHKTDDEIIDLARKSWKSKAYDHYSVSLIRHLTGTNKPHHLTFKFTCKHDPVNHPPQLRDRMKTAQGTKNLDRSSTACNRRRGAADDSNSGAQQTLTESVSRYTPSRHRAIIAMRCAVSHRPFNCVADPLYLEEVQLLHPGIKIPSPSTVARDVQTIYREGSIGVKEYFSNHNGAIHLVIDGWTAPFATSYLGIVVVWLSKGKIWRAILEFIRLTERHTDQHLAEVTAGCLKRFGLENKFHTICMDNASNCDAAADHLANLVDNFRGSLSRSRCFPHTVNLVAKALITFFFRQPKRKKSVKVATGTKRKYTRRQGIAVMPAGAANIEVESGESDIEIDPSLHDTDELPNDDEASILDPAKAEHDNAAVSSVKVQAITTMVKRGVTLSEEERFTALGLFPKVAGLARRVHDSSILKEKFEKLVDAQQDPETRQKKSLDRRVPTRWNSDFACLAAHLKFETPVRQLTSDAKNDLKVFALTEGQWALAKELVDVLEIFQDVTDLFSQAEVPLVHEVIPMLEAMEYQLVNVRDATDIPNVIRIAAQAALLVLSKYYALTDDNEVYRIAIVMCPDKKLEWFANNPDWRPEDRALVKDVVCNRWKETYAPSTPTNATTGLVDQTSSSSLPSHGSQIRGRWASSSYGLLTSASTIAPRDPDSIEAYLGAPVMSSEDLKASGGPLVFWEQALRMRPRVARMSLDFLSAPASSVDAEHAFSVGRLQVNHLQHGISSQSFKALVALGSWYNTPLMTKDLKAATAAVESRADRKGKNKATDNIIEITDN